MSKHTAGPWFILDFRSQGEEQIAISAASKPSAVISRIRNDVSGLPLNDEDEANARLIAAAPELLKALELAVKQNQHDMLLTGEELRQCEAAIAKARSEK